MAIIISNGATITANTPAINLSDLLVFDFDMKRIVKQVQQN